MHLLGQNCHISLSGSSTDWQSANSQSGESWMPDLQSNVSQKEPVKPSVHVQVQETGSKMKPYEQGRGRQLSEIVEVVCEVNSVALEHDLQVDGQ